LIDIFHIFNILQFMVKMQLEYNEAAKEAGIYVVSACGFDCIPADLGVVFTQQKFGGEVNAVEVYGEIWSTTRNKGSYFNYGTWESTVYELTHASEQRELHEKLYPTKLPKFTPVLKPRYVCIFLNITVYIILNCILSII